VCSIMDTYESEGTVILKQYGVKDAQDPKNRQCFLYPDFLALDFTGCRNSLNFPNMAFMIRSDEPRGQIVATFVSNKEMIPVVNLMFDQDQEEFDQWKITILDAKEFQSAIRITNLVIAETVTSYFRTH
ncbi:1324_t:CDS:2, partial [Dentiscutata heterogama]